MKSNEEILDILRKYADGLCTQEEDRFIRNWLYENMASNEYDEIFEKLLESCRSEMDREKIEDSYRKLENRISGLKDSSNKGKSWMRRGLFMSLAAASIAAVMLLTINILNTEPKESSELSAETSLHTFHVPAGSNADFRLPDGTILKVNSETTVKYPENFSDAERRIYIDGEAYFDVAHDSARPFIVETEWFDVKVHGTEFNINTYNNEKSPNVVLVKGAVEVSDEFGRFFMKPGMMASSGGNGISVTDVDVEEHICWKDGYMLLKGTDLGTISSRLSTHYGIDVNFYGIKTHLYGKLDLHDDIREVFNNINKIVPINVTRTETGYSLTAR